MDYALLTRAIITYAADLVESGTLAPRIRSQRDFANLVFPEAKDPDQAWKYLRRGQKGKTQVLSLEKALLIAEILGTDLPRLIMRAEIMLESGWTIENDVSRREVSAGRPKKSGKVADIENANEKPQ